MDRTEDSRSFFQTIADRLVLPRPSIADGDASLETSAGSAWHQCRPVQRATVGPLPLCHITDCLDSDSLPHWETVQYFICMESQDKKMVIILWVERFTGIRSLRSSFQGGGGVPVFGIRNAPDLYVAHWSRQYGDAAKWYSHVSSMATGIGILNKYPTLRGPKWQGS